MNKKAIENRILAEYKKHQKMGGDEWAKIAAAKINSQLKQGTDEPEGATCGHHPDFLYWEDKENDVIGCTLCDDTPDKVSDCCGAETEVLGGVVYGGRDVCLDCYNTCDVVEEGCGKHCFEEPTIHNCKSCCRCGRFDTREDDTPDKVSDCCGAECRILRVENGCAIKHECKSCGEPCDAVEDDEFPIPDSYKSDTKPDPIEPIDTEKINEIIDDNLMPELTKVAEVINVLMDKIDEQLEVINWLLEQHD